MDFFGEVFGELSHPCSCCELHFRNPVLHADIAAGTSASLFEGLHRVVGDGLSAQDWFATKKGEEAPVQLPWEASIAEELPYGRLAKTSLACM